MLFTRFRRDLEKDKNKGIQALEKSMEKIEQWKRELLDTSKRNRMINYRETKLTTLKLLEPELTEMFNQLALEEKTLSFQRPLGRDTDFRTWAALALLETLSYPLPAAVGDIKAEGTVMARQKALKNLRSKARLAEEEQGTNILYLSFGFISWRESDRANAQWMKSPLLLMPVQLGLKSLNAPFTLCKYDDEIQVNPTLAYLFSQNYGINLPVFALKNRDSIEDYLETIEEIADLRGWKLIREVSLGLLSFLKISMYHDLEQNSSRILEHPVIRAISGDRDALPPLPEKANDFHFDETQPSEWYEVVDSDSSQEEAILLSKLGVSFVMQGPPGTGKSQTITNIIAEALGDGKKVLFVSEKSAALEVVFKRLKEAGLDDFCLSLHDYKANKKEIIDAIGANLRMEPEYTEASAGIAFAELFYDRALLDQYARELHKPIAPLGESAYTVFGKLEKLKGASELHFKMDDPAGWTKEAYQSRLTAVSALERALHDLDGKITDNPWKDTAAVSAGQVFKAELLRDTDGLSDNLNEMEGIVTSFGQEYGTAFSPTRTYVESRVREMDMVLSMPLFPAAWREEDKREALRERARREEKIDEAEQGHAGRLHHLLEVAEATWDTDKSGFSLRELDQAFSNPEIWEREGGDGYLADINAESLRALTAAEKGLENISAAFADAKRILRIKTDDSPDSVLMVSRVLAILRRAPKMETQWFDIRKTKAYAAAAQEIQTHQDLVRKKTEELLKDWDAGILEMDAEGMLVRFKTEYTGLFHKMKGSYKSDVKQVKALSRIVGLDIGDAEVINVLQQVQSLDEEKKWFSENEGHLKTLFGERYEGLATDPVGLSEGIDAARRIAGEFPYANIPADVIDAIHEIENSIQLAGEVRRLADLLDEELIRYCFDVLKSEGISEGSCAEEILPETKERIASEEKWNDLILQIENARKGRQNRAKYEDAHVLIGVAEAIQGECVWFLDNIPDIGAELGIDGITDAEPLHTMIGQAKMILKNHDAIAEKDETEALTGLFGKRYTGNFTDWQGILRDIDAVEAFEEQEISKDIDPFIQAVCGSEEKRKAAREKVGRLKFLLRETEAKLGCFGRLFPKTDLRGLPFHEISEKYEACIHRFDELSKWLAYVEARKECDRLGLSDFTEKVAEQDNRIPDVRNAFARGFYAAWLNLVLGDVPSVQVFTRKAQDERIAQFISLDQRQFALSKERIRERIIRSFPDPNKVTGARSEIRILRHEMEKKRRIMPLRKLFHEIPDLLLTLKPCLMMSPLSVAYFLNAEDYHFDMVIFDEASQIFPEDAVGAIFRADQTIIAGDTKQLPPTNFFSVSTSNTDTDYDDEEDAAEEEVYDSILEAAADVLPSRTLRWHYRSRNEQLITFSNREIYRNELVTFPGSRENEPDTGVEFVFVADGYYEGGGRNYNTPEARRCMALVKEHIERHPDRSLGIIAFSEKQQQAIALEIQRFREQNPKYEPFFKEDREGAFFVKNLENVQGDERDTIIFSVGYAKTKAQKAAGRPMAMRFGPLGISGGERRLNVAITRAKINIKMVSSILPSDIDLGRTNSDGIRMLRAYLAFAMRGGAASADGSRGQLPDDFADEVYAYLCESGYKAKRYVGCSGYRIDIAVLNPANEDEFAAGIECDGMTYASARTARDRDRLREAVLKEMGWNMYRVWSAEWYKNPDVEKKRLIDFLRESIEKAGSKQEAHREEQVQDNAARRAPAERPPEKIREESEAQGSAAEASQPEKPEEAGTAEERPEEGKRTAEETERRRKEWNAERRALKANAAEKRGSTEQKKAQGAPAARCDVRVSERADTEQREDPGESEQKTKRHSYREIRPAGDLYDELVLNGFSCIDNRMSSGIIWALYDKEMGWKLEKIAAKYHARYKFEKRGAIATEFRPAWRIMIVG